MKKIKIIITFLISIPLFILAGCSSGEKPQKSATDFLEAYFATDYAKAASFCTPELAEEFTQAVKELDELSPEVKELMKRHTGNYTPKILSVEEPKGKDTVIISYSIIKRAEADSISTGGETIIEKQLSMVKYEQGWRVAALNNNK